MLVHAIVAINGENVVKLKVLKRRLRRYMMINCSLFE